MPKRKRFQLDKKPKTVGDFWQDLTLDDKLMMVERWNLHLAQRIANRKTITIAELPFVPVTHLSPIRLEQMRRMRNAYEYRRSSDKGEEPRSVVGGTEPQANSPAEGECVAAVEQQA